MSLNRHLVKNITSTDVDFQRVETKFDETKKRSLLETASFNSKLI